MRGWTPPPGTGVFELSLEIADSKSVNIVRAASPSRIRELTACERTVEVDSKLKMDYDVDEADEILPEPPVIPKNKSDK